MFLRKDITQTRNCNCIAQRDALQLCYMQTLNVSFDQQVAYLLIMANDAWENSVRTMWRCYYLPITLIFNPLTRRRGAHHHIIMQRTITSTNQPKHKQWKQLNILSTLQYSTGNWTKTMRVWACDFVYVFHVNLT